MKGMLKGLLIAIGLGALCGFLEVGITASVRASRRRKLIRHLYAVNRDGMNAQVVCFRNSVTGKIVIMFENRFAVQFNPETYEYKDIEYVTDFELKWCLKPYPIELLGGI